MDKLALMDRTISKTNKKEVALSSFSFFFAGIVEYCQGRVNSTDELEQKLCDLGYSVGYRFYELSVYREKNLKRENKHLSILQYINSTIWKNLYGKPAGENNMEKSLENPNLYMIFEQQPLITRYISLPKDLTGVKCAFFNAGIIKGILTCAEFPADVKIGSTKKGDTVYIIEFHEEVIKREENLK